MNALFFCTSPVLAKNPTLFLKSRTLSPEQGRTLKHDIFSKTKSLESCETPLVKTSAYEQSDIEELPQKQTFLDADGNLSCKDLHKFPNPGNDERKKYAEAERRRKIGLANEGRTPWNKGRKHTAETLRLIRERTIEALKDPKVRRKISEVPRFFSEESKLRKSIALKKRWAERLKEKKLKEEWCLIWTFSIAEAAKMGGYDQNKLQWNSYEELKINREERGYLMWTFSIAEAAKIGGYDQNKLEWNSYEELNLNIHLKYMQWKEENERRREIRKLKMSEAAERKAARMARLDRERWEKEERAKLRKMKKAKKSEDKIIASLNHLKKEANSKLSKKLVVPVPGGEVDTSNETDPKNLTNIDRYKVVLSSTH